jgi:hypothetical protein
VENGRHRLRIRRAETKEDLRPALEALIPALVPDLPPEKLAEFTARTDMRRVFVWEVLTDPRTLVPTEAKTEQVTDLVLPDDRVEHRVERRHYRFTWTDEAPTSCD